MPARISSYGHHKPTGQAVVTLNGKDHYLGRHGTPESRRFYDRLLAEYLAIRGRQNSVAAPPSDLTMNELLMAYWDHARRYNIKDGQPTSEPGTIRQALGPVHELYGESQAREFGPLALKATRRAMIERGWCRGYINKQVDRIKRMFAWAAENELLPVGIYQALRTVQGLRKDRSDAREKPPVGPAPEQHVEAVLSQVSPTVATMIRVQRLTGMRPQEIILMRAVDVDRTDPTCWVYRPHRFKGEHHERERLIFLGPRCQELLQPYLVHDPVSYMFSPKRAESQRHAEQRARRTR